MICAYDGREIVGEPFVVQMKRRGLFASAMSSKEEDSSDVPEVGDVYFHDRDCYELYVADELEYEAVALPGSETG